MMNSNLKLKNGQMLIIGILFLTILLIFSTTIFTKVRYFINFGTNTTLREQARHVAEAGVDFAAREITNTPAYAGTGATPVNVGETGNETGNFEVIVNSPSQNLKTATVTGYAPKTPGHKAKTKIQIEFKPSNAASRDDLLARGVNDNTVAINNGFVYSFGGRDGGCTLAPIPPSDVQFAKINPGSGYLDAFGQTQQLPETRAAAGAVTGANGYIYVIGGVAGCSNPGDHRSTVYFTQPNPITGQITSWNTATNPIPTAGVVLYAFFTDGYIYVIRENQAIYYALQDPFTGQVGPWKTDSVAAPDDWPSYVFVKDGISGYIYHISGHYTRNVWYSPVTGGNPITSFTLIPDVLPTETSESAVTSANGFIYVMGGRKKTLDQQGNGRTPLVESVYYAKIDPALHTVGPFTTSPKNLPQPRFSPDIFSSIAANNKLFVIGGRLSETSGSVGGNIWVADIDAADLDGDGDTGEISDWTDNGGLITYSGWGLDKATYIYK